MTLLESAIRLAALMAVLIWLPGWLASRGPLRPVSVLHPAIIGAGIHLGVLVLVTGVSQDVDGAAALVLVGTALVVGALGIRRFRSGASRDEGPRAALPAGALAAVAACVGIAAALRWFHNYHFDDFQHLVYLTEIERQGTLFPRQFMLHVAWGDLMDRALVVSRYPYWAADHAVVSRLSGVPLGDAYFFLGLGLFALTVGMIVALLRDVLSSTAGAILALVVLIAYSQLVASDDLLNFGGYPFQSGKLFVLVGGLAAVAYWRIGHPAYLVYMGIALFIGPLLHTNNVIGTTLTLVVVAGAALVSRVRPRRLLLPAAAVTAALAIAAMIALVSGGFMQMVSPSAISDAEIARARERVVDVLPDHPLAGAVREPGSLPVSVAAPPQLVGRLESYQIFEYRGWHYGVPGVHLHDEVEDLLRGDGAGIIRASSRQLVEVEVAKILLLQRGIDERALGGAGNVAGRVTLFLKRAAPIELLALFAVVGIHAGLSRWAAPVRRSALLVMLVGSSLVVLVNAGNALVRQVATMAFKPGYLHMRGSLMAVRPMVRGTFVLTDPITYVYGNAAGWGVSQPPPLVAEVQFGRLLMFHPLIDGQALEFLLQKHDGALVIVNEAVLGPGSAAKFERVRGMRHLLATGGTVVPERALAERADAIVTQLYSLDYASARHALSTTADTLWRVLFRRPLHLFSLSGLDTASSEPAGFHEAFQQAIHAAGSSRLQSGSIEQHPFLSSVLVRAGVPDGCFARAHVALQGQATFDATVLIHALPGRVNASQQIDSGYVPPGQIARTQFSFRNPVCGPGEVTFFLHSDYLYDFRFFVHRVDWEGAVAAPSDVGSR